MSDARNEKSIADHAEDESRWRRGAPAATHREFLAKRRVAPAPVHWIDIEEDGDGLTYVDRAQSGGRTIPMIVFPDGSRLLEPGDDELGASLA